MGGAVKGILGHPEKFFLGKGAEAQLAAVLVAGAIFLILELRTPFTRFLQIPNTPFLDAITHLGK